MSLEKIEDVAVRTAAKAVVALLFGINRKRWRALHVKGAQANQRCAAAPQRQVPTHFVGQRELVLDRVDIDAAGFNTTRHGGQDHFLNLGQVGSSWWTPWWMDWGCRAARSSPAPKIRTPERRAWR